MREEVGRSIGLSARKVQVRFKPLILSHESLISIVSIASTRLQVWFQASIFPLALLCFCETQGTTYLIPIHRINVRRLGARVIARTTRVLPQRPRAHRSTAPFLMCPPLPFCSHRHLPRLIHMVYLPMTCTRRLIPSRRPSFSSVRTGRSSSSSSPRARAAVYLVLGSLEHQHQPPLPLLLRRVSHTRLNDSNNNSNRCSRRMHRRSLTLILKRDHH
jgi:hypothetical protein